MNKQFRLTPTLNRDTATLKNFIVKNVARGNNIIIDGWRGFDLLDNLIKIEISVRYVIDSTSHIESIWAQIGTKLKEAYTNLYQVNHFYFSKRNRI